MARGGLSGEPGHRADVVVLLLEGRELDDGTVRGVPDVDRRGESNGDAVVGTPLDEVQVVIVQQLRRVQDTRGRARDVASRLRPSDRGAAVLHAIVLEGSAVLRRVEHAEVAHVALGSRGRLVLVVDDARIAVVDAAVR